MTALNGDDRVAMTASIGKCWSASVTALPVITMTTSEGEMLVFSDDRLGKMLTFSYDRPPRNYDDRLEGYRSVVSSTSSVVSRHWIDGGEALRCSIRIVEM